MDAQEESRLVGNSCVYVANIHLKTLKYLKTINACESHRNVFDKQYKVIKNPRSPLIIITCC